MSAIPNMLNTKTLQRQRAGITGSPLLAIALLAGLTFRVTASEKLFDATDTPISAVDRILASAKRALRDHATNTAGFRGAPMPEDPLKKELKLRIVSRHIKTLNPLQALHAQKQRTSMPADPSFQRIRAMAERLIFADKMEQQAKREYQASRERYDERLIFADKMEQQAKREYQASRERYDEKMKASELTNERGVEPLEFNTENLADRLGVVGAINGSTEHISSLSSDPYNAEDSAFTLVDIETEVMGNGTKLDTCSHPEDFGSAASVNLSKIELLWYNIF